MSCDSCGKNYDINIVLLTCRKCEFIGVLPFVNISFEICNAISNEANPRIIKNMLTTGCPFKKWEVKKT